ncbi:T9SS type A sorting domain-containing protein [bacterium]|nr:T9SS type A sorting domain-containing protein [bacterium]MBU1638735.1 T9SS type A sorting domain-containing protein [bacterium]MBU1921544.1 T9SS type A sorting domain-containing protein [bacterium]
MSRWFCIFLLFSLPLTARPYQVTGTILGGEGFQLRWVFAVPTSLDTFYAAVAIPIFNTYTVSNLDSGSYFFAAYQDVNTNLIPDLGEPFGFYGGTLPAPLPVDQDLAGIDIELSAISQGGFSGEITYSGESTGTTLIVAYDNPEFTGTPSGAGFLMNNTGNGSYTAITDTQATFYALAFMDLNGNLQYEADEPLGVYGGATPQSFEVELPNMPDAINIRLADADVAVEQPRIGALPEGFMLGTPYPNPFNSETTIPFVLGTDADVRLLVYDLLGREIGQIDSGRMASGAHQVKFSAQGYSSGIYFIELVVNGMRSQQRVALIR